MAPQVAGCVEETEVLLTITKTIAVGIPLFWIRRIVTKGRGFNIAEFVKIGPKPF